METKNKKTFDSTRTDRKRVRQNRHAREPPFFSSCKIKKRCYAGPGPLNATMSPRRCCIVTVSKNNVLVRACSMQCYHCAGYASQRCTPCTSIRTHASDFLPNRQDSIHHAALPTSSHFLHIRCRPVFLSTLGAHPIPSLGPGCRSPGPAARARPSLPLSRSNLAFFTRSRSCTCCH